MLYAITAGKYMGDFLIFTHTKPIANAYTAIALPELIEIVIPAKDVEEGLKTKILDPVEKMSRSVYNETTKQIEIKKKQLLEEKKRITDEYHNRREQLATSIVLDSEISEE